MEVAQNVMAPPAFVDFCRREPQECQHVGPVRRSVPLTLQRRKDLQFVNDAVNAAIREVSDLVQHGVEDRWSVPTNNQGDCEDFALLKRKMLIERGWPSSVLLLAVVRTSTGEGHAVLLAVTDAGELVLDNRTSAIKAWNDSGYFFFLRQAQGHSMKWVAVDVQRRVAAATALTAVASAPHQSLWR
jgi:predicted transglutaminase-like cysteine proteinase